MTSPQHIQARRYRHFFDYSIFNLESVCQDLPPWIPAVTQHSTSGTGEKAELHMIRAVNTGVINVGLVHRCRIALLMIWKLSLGVQESSEKIERREKRRSQKTKLPLANDENKALPSVA